MVQCMVCQELVHLRLLILPIKKYHFFPSKHKETEGTVEDRVKKKKKKFSSSYYPLLSLQ